MAQRTPHLGPTTPSNPLRGWSAGVVVGLGVLGAPAPASATCLAPPASVLWSYPGNGSENVPTDADLFYTGEVFGTPTLNGLPLQRLSARAFDLGELEPQTTYEVRWETAVIRFTTGDQLAQARLEPSAPLELTRDPDVPYDCPLVESQGCYDTGLPTVVAFEDHTPKLATVVDVLSCNGSVRSIVWPAECGPPMITSYDPVICASLRTTLGAGLSEPTGYVCSVPAEDPTSIPRASSCVGAWPPADVRTIQGAGASSSPRGEPPAGDAAAGDAAAGCSLRASSYRREGWVSLLAALVISGGLLRRRARA
jgi:hypothetical protein